ESGRCWFVFGAGLRRAGDSKVDVATWKTVQRCDRLEQLIDALPDVQVANECDNERVLWQAESRTRLAFGQWSHDLEIRAVRDHLNMLRARPVCIDDLLFESGTDHDDPIIF